LKAVPMIRRTAAALLVLPWLSWTSSALAGTAHPAVIPAPLAAGAASTAANAPPGTDFTVAPFGRVRLLRPDDAARQVVLLITGQDGWNVRAERLAAGLVANHTLVVGVDLRHYALAPGAGRRGCRALAVDFEALAHGAEKRAGLADYEVPIVVGDAAGAALAYAVIGDAPTGTFDAAVGLGFEPRLHIAHEPCRASALAFTRDAGSGWMALGPLPPLAARWIALPGHASVAAATAALVAACESLHATRPDRTSPTASGAADDTPVADLPLVEIPATSSVARGPLVILLTGDGGWAGIDQQLAGALARRGVRVVGWNSLRYYWNGRTPQQAADDLARIMGHYRAAWGRRDTVLVGYSFGADVLPFLLNLLPAEQLARIRAVALLAPSRSASFEVHVAEWLPGGNQGDRPTLPEARRLGALKVLCVQGREDSESLCPRVVAPGWQAVALDGGHHFGGNYERLATRLLQFIGD
jgi:type IV secretory pathway VirJ component